MFIKSRYISIAAYICSFSAWNSGTCDQRLILCISYAVIPKNSININHESAISNIVFPKNKLIILIIIPANNNANKIFPTFVKSNLVTVMKDYFDKITYFHCITFIAMIL